MRNNRRWMLGGEPPEPQDTTPAEPIEVDDLRNGDTHTGTDPLGRAIGPRESHLHVKRVHDGKGKIVTPKAGKGMTPSRAEGRARKIAEATGTKAEAVDNPTPILPAEVAALHGDAAEPADEPAKAEG